ncbi:MAG: metallophosphoesterase, partial [Lachnospiraceae bacterium]|nr:metallophosphoesterase [Lachnospiraceae bacterium]
VQRIQKHTTGPGTPDHIYGITEVVSNSLIIPPCQYGKLTLHADGSMSYHTKYTDVSGWAAKHGETNPDLLDFPAFSSEYIRSVISRQTYSEINYIPEHIKNFMVDFYADLYSDYYAGRQIDYRERTSEYGYQMWERFMNPSKQFRQVEGMLKDSMVNNNNVEIPNPIHQTWER